MSEEEKAVPSPATDAVTEGRKPRRWPVVVSVLAVFVAVFFVAFLHWHEEPTFCSTMCHSPMDKYVQGYYSTDQSLEVTAHAESGVTCLSCHYPQAKMLDLVHEVILTVTDDYTDPLPARQYAEGDSAALVSDEFCGRCHDGVTAPTKESATEGVWGDYDPHNIPDDVASHLTAGYEGGAITCGDCHTIHKGSTLACAECHSDVFNEETVPDGWQLPTTDKKAEVATTFGPYDMHSIIETDAFQDVAFHQTAGADGGLITCTDCHSTDADTANTFICSECHASNYDGLIPEGWTVPDTTVDTDMKTAATASMGAYDPHTLISSSLFTETVFHQTAGADGGMIGCVDCHGTDGQLNSFKCSECHATDYADLVPDGWTTPESTIDMPMMGTSASDEETEAAADEEAAETDEAAESDTAAAASDATYKDGTYTASGKGIGGDVPVTVTIADGKISSVEVGDNGETPALGGQAIEQLPALIVEANGTAGVDAYSGATITSKAIFSAVEDCLSQAAE